MSEVHTVTDVPTPPKALWKRGLKVGAIITLVAVGASAVYAGLKKGDEDSETTETPAA